MRAEIGFCAAHFGAEFAYQDTHELCRICHIYQPQQPIRICIFNIIVIHGTMAQVMRALSICMHAYESGRNAGKLSTNVFFGFRSVATTNAVSFRAHNQLAKIIFDSIL